ncbi:MAG: N-acetyltransferase [Acidobacteria bacterium]|nr:N-acetyltransferase [Acidobacteriota bacterium]
MKIRKEEEHDISQIFDLNFLAFGGTEESELVDRMRHVRPYFAFVAEIDDRIIGHIAFSEVTLNGNASNFLGLAPMAVLPKFQNQGVGSALVTKGLGWIIDEGFSAVFLIGHPNYYPRFGFTRAGVLGFTCEFPAPDESFLVKELIKGSLENKTGIIEYNKAFKPE